MKLVLLLTCVFVYLKSLTGYSLDGHQYSIRPNRCQSPKDKREGVCMFSWTCTQNKGVHLSLCRDRFLVGSCCKLSEGVEAGKQPSPGGSTQITTTALFTNNVKKDQLSTNHLQRVTVRPPYSWRSNGTSPPRFYLTKLPAALFQLASEEKQREGERSQSATLQNLLNELKITTGLFNKWSGSFDVTRHEFITQPPVDLFTDLERNATFVNHTDNTKHNTISSIKHPTSVPLKHFTTSSLKHPTIAPLRHSTRSPSASISTTYQGYSKRPATPSRFTTPETVSPDRIKWRTTIHQFLNDNHRTPPTEVVTAFTYPSPPYFKHPAVTPASVTNANIGHVGLQSHSHFASFIFNKTVQQKLDIKSVCGKRWREASARVVGGQSSVFAKWPWLISLRERQHNKLKHKCGAALLNDFWAITAAHCLEKTASPVDIVLRMGEFDFASESEPLPHLERRVQLIVTHPRFNSATFEFDIALMRFYEPVVLQRNIVPICLRPDDDRYIGAKGVIAGWGRLQESGELPQVLQEVEMSVIDNRQCEVMFRRAGYTASIPDIFLCAGQKEGGVDACEGDSGGPLSVQAPDGRWVLLGVISWGIGCAVPNQPGVYTRVSKMADWIEKIITA